MRKKTRKIEVTLWDRDLRQLQAYCNEHGLQRAVAIRRLVREGLKDYAAASAPDTSRFQLGLFDCVQTELFENTSTPDL